MPELPEVESIRRSLRPLVGRTVVGARLFRTDMCTTSSGTRPHPRDLLAGARIAELARRGKQLAIIARDGRILVIHLGMTGGLRLLHPGTTPDRADHIHARWTLDDGSSLSFRDPRRFGGLWALPSRQALAERWRGLGPDGLEITPAALAGAVRASRRAIKAALLDQAVVAGVGNIYADEALFLAGIRPARRARRLSATEHETLAYHIRNTLTGAIRAGGSTFRDYADASGSPGRAQFTHAVYGRGGEACTRCSGPLSTATIAQRTTVYCRSCQR